MKLLLPASTYLGEKALDEAIDEISTLGQCALVVTSNSMIRGGHVEHLISRLQSKKVRAAVFSNISGEPTDAMIEQGLKVYRENQCDFIIGIGGGSPLDSAKAIAAMTANPGTISDYNGRFITMPTPAVVAIPSTAGTGSEVTQFTIITDTKKGTKMLLKGAVLMPRIAVVDSSLTTSMPKNVTAATGLDALTHAVESYTSRKANDFSDTFALKAVRRIFKFLPIAYELPDNKKARAEMSLAAYEAGLSFNNSSVTLVHGMSRPIGAQFHVPHGISNAMLLKECLAFALDGAAERFARLAIEIGVATADMDIRMAADKFLQAIDHICRICEIPTLRGYGIDKKAFIQLIPKMTQDALDSGSPANTRKLVTSEDIQRIYQRLIER